MVRDPTIVGRYKVEALLGRGAMGVVYRAHDPDIDRSVAIKLIRTDLLDGDDRAHYVTRFRNEARMVGRCIHPNIVGIYDFTLHEGCPCLILEYVDGKDLARTFRSAAAPELQTVGRVMAQVLDALAYAHAYGIIHRDIKPGNILLSDANDVKVTDFGISRALASSSTLSSVLVGTPSYMSPEQCLGRAVDARSDLFSLGCVFYELLAGRRAFEGPNYVATTHRILHDAPQRLAELRPDLPPDLVGVVERALAKRAEDRFATAAEMSASLNDALRKFADPLASADATAVLRLRPVLVPTAHPNDAEPFRRMPEIPSDSLTTIERSLAYHVGPMARFHLRRVLAEARTPAELGERLSALVPRPMERERLRAELLKILGSSLESPHPEKQSEQGTPASHVDSVTKALTRIIGPIAPRLLKQALLSVRTPDELEAACLALIDGATDREEFRKFLVRARQ